MPSNSGVHKIFFIHIVLCFNTSGFLQFLQTEMADLMEHHTWIEFCLKLPKTKMEIHEVLELAFGGSNMGRRVMFM